MSAINALAPVDGDPLDPAVIRALASAAKAEIEQLQASSFDRVMAETFENKRIVDRVIVITSSPNPSINVAVTDDFEIRAQAVNISGFTIIGTPTNGQVLFVIITGVPGLSITWGTNFESSTVLLPASIPSSARLDVGFKFNAVTQKFRCLAVA